MGRCGSVRSASARPTAHARQDAREDALKEGASTPGRLADLLAYETRVESTPEWPFDSSTLWRFGLYLLIPVASMVAGAVVDRIVDMMLG